MLADLTDLFSIHGTLDLILMVVDFAVVEPVPDADVKLYR